MLYIRFGMGSGSERHPQEHPWNAGSALPPSSPVPLSWQARCAASTVSNWMWPKVLSRPAAARRSSHASSAPASPARLGRRSEAPGPNPWPPPNHPCRIVLLDQFKATRHVTLTPTATTSYCRCRPHPRRCSSAPRPPPAPPARRRPAGRPRWRGRGRCAQTPSAACPWQCRGGLQGCGEVAWVVSGVGRHGRRGSTGKQGMVWQWRR